MLKIIFLKRNLLIIFVIISLLILSGCNALKKSTAELDYKEIKTMVIDILQTDDGKKVIQASLEDPEVKKKMTLDSKEVKEIIKSEFLTPENKDILKSMFEDPEFASELGKTLKKENEKILTDLMKDPEYRKMLIEVMKDKEYEKMLLDVMKSNAYRIQMMLVIKDSFESPMFKYDLLKLMEKASREALKPDKKKEDDKSGKNEE